jgi:uncharacterized damage-inducible protein DinB
MDELGHFWERFAAHRRVTLRLIEAFPEAHLFSYRPSADLRTYGEIANELLWEEMLIVRLATQGAGSKGDLEQRRQQRQPEDKAGLLAAFDEAHRASAQLWATMTFERFEASEADPWTGQVASVRSRLEGLLDHEIHHRGQGYIYVRLLGIEPPDFWQR